MFLNFQFIAHLIGDYILQTDWMATRKRDNKKAAAVHAFFYTLPFLVCTREMFALMIIGITHFYIDHYGLARYVTFAKNWLTGWEVQYDATELDHLGNPKKCVVNTMRWEDCKGTGFHKDRPVWLATWLLIITDNTLHLIINYFSLHYLG